MPLSFIRVILANIYIYIYYTYLSIFICTHINIYIYIYINSHIYIYIFKLRFNTLEGGSLTVCAMPTNTIGEVKQMLVDLHPMLHVKAHILTNELADDDQTVESLGPSPTVVYTKAEVEVATASAICEKGFVQVNIPEGVEIITAGAFKSCDQVVIVKACESLTEVRFFAFLGCKSLRELDLSRSSLTYIDTSAFANCRSLESVSLPETIGLHQRLCFRRLQIFAQYHHSSESDQD